VLSHYIGDCPPRSEVVDGTSDINCQQHDRLRNRLSYVSVWLYSCKPDLHLCIRIQHSVLGQEGSHAPDPPSDGGWDYGDDDGQRSPHSDGLGARFFCESTKLSHHCGYKREIMNRNPIPSRQTPMASFQVGHGLAFLTVLLSLSTASIGQTQSEAQSPVSGATIHVTQVLGFEGAKHNATGDLKIQGDVVQFQRDGSPTAQVNISSIQDIFVEDGDKQVGGTAMTLGKTAAPFGGGRVVSLFAHKKYDFLTVEYLDNSGGFHGAIFQLEKGQGETFKKALVANGAHITSPVERTPTQSALEVKNENK
jgi:hypothetical protein